jgi:hypothetical protein
MPFPFGHLLARTSRLSSAFSNVFSLSAAGV